MSTCGPGMCHWENYIALVNALRAAFPHFQENAPVTPEAIKELGREYQEMVMGWEPQRSEIEFVDIVGHPGKLTLEDGVWAFDGILRAPFAPKTAQPSEGGE